MDDDEDGNLEGGHQEEEEEEEEVPYEEIDEEIKDRPMTSLSKVSIIPSVFIIN